MATKRRRPASSQPPAKRRRPQSGAPKDDSTYGQSLLERAKDYHLGTARFPINALNPVWKEGQNRDPDGKQIQALLKIFKEQGVQREAVAHRLRVICPRAEFERMVAHLAQTGSPTAKTAPVPSFFDWVEVNGSRIELMAGQHRVKAFDLLLAKGNKLPTSSEEELPWWECEVYNSGRVRRAAPLRRWY